MKKTRSLTIAGSIREGFRYLLTAFIRYHTVESPLRV